MRRRGKDVNADLYLFKQLHTRKLVNDWQRLFATVGQRNDISWSN